MEQLPQTAELMNLPTTHLHNANNLPALTTAQKASANVLRSLSLAGNPGFPIANVMLAEYAIFLGEHAPDLTPAILKKIVDKMLTGKLPYDVNKGIRNIFEGFEYYRKHFRKCFQLFNIETGKTDETHEDEPSEKFDKKVWTVYNPSKGMTDNNLSELAHRAGFAFVGDSLKRARENYINSCRYRNENPQQFNIWLEAFRIKQEEERTRNEVEEQERLERVNSEAERLKKELSDKLARKSIDW